MAGAALGILLVEDDDDNRELLAELLRLEGHEVVTAADGEEALRIAGGRSFDALVADVGLPGMDGLALSRELRQRSPGLAVVAVSGWGDDAGVSAARGREVDAVVVKPADPARLLGALESALRARRRARSEP
jgi:two-component system OmpR family response regulator